MKNTLKRAMKLAPWLSVAAILATAPALAQAPSQAQRDAIKSQCRSDYMAHCSSVPPGGEASLQCLQKNMASLSSGCQGAVRAVEAPAAAKPAETAAPKAAAPAAAATAAPKAAAAFGSAALGAVVAAAGAAALGAAVSAGLAAGASTARTALWQLDERLVMFFCRHCSDASPPGGTLAQCAI